MTTSEFLNYWNYFLLIDKDIQLTDRYVSHSINNYLTYSPEFSRILLVTCAEIDTVCRILCKEIDNSCNFSDTSTRSGDIKGYCGIILGKFPNLPTTEIYITTLKIWINPWEKWTLSPYKSPYWWSDYQAVKHYRHSNFEKATLHNSLYACAALLVLLMYLHKTVFDSTMPVADNPNCFHSGCLFDIDFNTPEAKAMLEKRQLPDF